MAQAKKVTKNKAVKALVITAKTKTSKNAAPKKSAAKAPNVKVAPAKKASSKTKAPKKATVKAPKAKSTPPSTRGKRYSSKQRAAILVYVDKHNAKNGRGGAAAAARKFAITQLTISKWMKETGAPAPTRKNSTDFNKTINRIAEVHKEMASFQDKLDKLRKEYVELKAAL